MDDLVGAAEIAARFGSSRTTRSERAVRLVVLLGLTLLAAGCSAARPAQLPARVALFGDSLSFEAQPYFTSLIKATGETALTYDSLGGTAICDALPKMREVEANHHPIAVELQFSGNALTPCMKGFKPGTQAYYDKYRADTEEAIKIFVPAGAHVYLIGAPITKSQQSDPNWDRLNQQYAEIAATDRLHVTYVDAGAAVEGPDHTFTETLPCLPIEQCSGPIVGGVPSNIVRSPDGTHFCPVETGNEEGEIGGCSTYSSGAFRYALAMVEALAGPASR
ncbi:MAG: hypothetical protein ACLPVF_02930 [Acidimicrobiales bacterium]